MAVLRVSLLEQYDTRLDQVQKVIFSIEQMRDLAAAISLPEGIYFRLVEDDDEEKTFRKP